MILERVFNKVLRSSLAEATLDLFNIEGIETGGTAGLEFIGNEYGENLFAAEVLCALKAAACKALVGDNAAEFIASTLLTAGSCCRNK